MIFKKCSINTVVYGNSSTYEDFNVKYYSLNFSQMEWHTTQTKQLQNYFIRTFKVKSKLKE